jgi:ATP-dependent Lon protease
MAIALLSLIKNKPIKKNIAMTGELSLTGQVLAIGGLREKTVAAIRNQIKQIIIPKSNLRDLDEIPEIVKNKVVFSPVRSFEEVIELLF